MGLNEENDRLSSFFDEKAKELVPAELREEFERERRGLLSASRDLIALKAGTDPEKEVEENIRDWIEETLIVMRRNKT
jgi:hypothetical protein